MTANSSSKNWVLKITNRSRLVNPFKAFNFIGRDKGREGGIKRGRGREGGRERRKGLCQIPWAIPLNERTDRQKGSVVKHPADTE